MPYTQFNSSTPDGTQTGPNAITSMRENLLAVRDGVVAQAMYGFNFSKQNGTGTDEMPQYMYYTKGVEKIRLTFTWDVTNMRPNSIVYAYTPDSGSNYYNIGTLTFTWAGSGYLSTTTWS